jgi:hypothetical protein
MPAKCPPCAPAKARKPTKAPTKARKPTKAPPKLDAALKVAVRAAHAAAHATKPGPAGYGGWVWVSTPDKAVAKHIRGVASRRKDRGMYRGFFPAMKGATNFLQTERACDAFSGVMQARGFQVYCKTNID